MQAWQLASFVGKIIMLCWNKGPSTVVMKLNPAKWHGVMHTNDIMWCHMAYNQETHVIRCHNKCFYEQKYHVKGFIVMYICRQQWCHEGAIWHIHKILCFGWLHNTVWKWTIKLSLVVHIIIIFCNFSIFFGFIMTSVVHIALRHGYL